MIFVSSWLKILDFKLLAISFELFKITNEIYLLLIPKNVIFLNKEFKVVCYSKASYIYDQEKVLCLFGDDLAVEWHCFGLEFEPHQHR